MVSSRKVDDAILRMPSEPNVARPAMAEGVRPNGAGAATLLHADVCTALAGEGDLPGPLQACAEAVAAHCTVALARIWIFEGGVMKLKASAGRLQPDDGRVRIPVGQFSIGHIARSRQPLLANSILEHPHVHEKEWSRRHGLTAFAGCPVVADGELEGVVAVFDDKPIPVTAFDAITSITRDLALFIKRHRVDEERDSDPEPLEPSPGAKHAVIVTDLAGTITDWSAGAESFFGYCREDLLGQRLDVLVPFDRAAEHRDTMKRVAAGECVSHPETVRRHKEGRPVEVALTTAALRDAAGQPVAAVTVAHGIADFKQLEDKYCLAQKMEAFGQLAGGVAHDFNNLITVILGYCEIAISRLTPNDSQREFLAEVHKAGERAETLTRQLLAFSRKRTIEPKVLDLNAAVSDTEKMLRRLIGEDILMTTAFAPFLKPVRIDPGQLQQVILNLAVNARDAMPRGGRLSIETANVILDDVYASSHPDVTTGCYVLFAMSDTGIGICPSVQPRIFEPLFTTKGPGRGTGLGLTTVQTIVKRSGGHITVRSEPNRGTTFSIYLPEALDPIAQSRSNTFRRKISSGNETVLLAEDDPSVRSLARHVLELNGYQVLEAGDGEEAVRIASNHPASIDLLVSDVVMPNLGGRPLADRLRALRPQLRILFLSGYTNDAVLRYGVIDSEFPFLQKPFTTSALAEKVREVLDEPKPAA